MHRAYLFRFPVIIYVLAASQASGTFKCLSRFAKRCQVKGYVFKRLINIQEILLNLIFKVGLLSWTLYVF